MLWPPAASPKPRKNADTLFRNLSEMSVFEVKRFLLDLSDDAASGVTALFILLGLFSVGVGVLLVFLIFVMLAAARRTEMGMARAIGAKRSHLVQMFIFEGTAYNLVSAALGVTVGLGVGYLIVAFQPIRFSAAPARSSNSPTPSNFAARSWPTASA